MSKASSGGMPVVLLTGFEPFGGDTVNPSWLVAQALHGRVIAGATVESLCLPCVFGESLQVLRRALLRHRPVLVLSLGLAANRAALSLERVAINLDDARIADNAGAQPVDQPVAPGGPSAYFSTLPIKAMVQALQQAGVPAEVSHTAGTFVCNHVFYGLMQQLRRRPGVRGGFMHLPLLPAQALTPERPGMALADQVCGVELALRTALSTSVDLAVTGGQVS
jgi:pyroglutamyl-peptidase